MVKVNKQKLMNKYLIIICFLMLMYLVFLMLVFLLHMVMPAKYFYDSNTIRRFMEYARSLNLMDSYNNTALFYKVFGFSYDSSAILAGVFTYSMAFVLLAVIVLSLMRRIKLSIGFFVYLTVWIFLFSLYLGQYSKEIIVLMLISLSLLILDVSFLVGAFIFLLSFLFYAFYFRIYWIFVLYYLGIIFSFLNSHRKGSSFILLIFLVLPFLISYKFGIFLTNSREEVNLIRLYSPDAQTMILNPITNSNVLTDVLNSIYVFLILIFPIPLLLKLKFRYLLFLILQLFNSYLVFIVLRFLSSYKNFQGFQDPVFRKMSFVVSFVLAFTFVQSFFEPDYGSFLKHQVPISPFYVYLYVNFIYLKNILRGKNESNSCC